MFIVKLDITGSMDEVKALFPAHELFLGRYHDSKHFIASGPREPFDGGIILAQARDRGEIERIMSEEPFVRSSIAEFQIIEFKPTKMSAFPSLEGPRGSGG